MSSTCRVHCKVQGHGPMHPCVSASWAGSRAALLLSWRHAIMGHGQENTPWHLGIGTALTWRSRQPASRGQLDPCASLCFIKVRLWNHARLQQHRPVMQRPTHICAQRRIECAPCEDGSTSKEQQQ